MRATLTKAKHDGVEGEDLASLRDMLLEEMRRVERLTRRVEHILRQGRSQRARPDAKAGLETGTGMASARSSPLDKIKSVISATKDLRLPNGNLSAELVAKLYGISLSQLAVWLGRTKQALSKTPDADSLQGALGRFERIARLRLVTKNDAEFRKWLRMPNNTLGQRTPLELMKAGLWQDMADKVDDMLTGMPT